MLLVLVAVVVMVLSLVGDGWWRAAVDGGAAVDVKDSGRIDISAEVAAIFWRCYFYVFSCAGLAKSFTICV